MKNSNELDFAKQSVRKPAKSNEIPEIALEVKHKRENIIPPVGIAHPDLVESFQKNMEDEEKILKDVKDLEKYHKENPYQTTKREVLSHGARLLEGLGGSIGGLLNALSGEAYFDDKGELLPEDKVKMLPNASELHEFTKEKTGKYLEPKSELSKNTQEAATDIGGSLPIPGLSAFAKLLIPAAGQSGKALVKHQGGTETQGDIAKLGIMGFLSLANIGNAPQMARRAYNEAMNMVPQGTLISAQPTERALQTIRNQSWFRTGRTTAKGPAFDEINRIEATINNGAIDAHDAMQIRRDINEAKKKLGAFNYEPGIDKATARRHLDQVDNAMRDSLNQYGNTQNPRWLDQYNRANEAYAVTQRSRQIQDVIAANPYTKPLQSDMAKTLFHLGGASAISQAPAVLTAAAPVAGIAKGVQIMNRMIRSPLLRNYYIRVIAEASSGNIPAMQNAIHRFDMEAKKLEKKSIRPHQTSYSKEQTSPLDR